jgi:uncharacterized protein
MRLAALHIYPVKSLCGVAVESAQVDALGAVGDRRFLIVDPAGVFMTQRTVPRMAQVGAFLDDSSLALRCGGFDEIRVRRAPDPGAPAVSVRIFKSEGLMAEYCGDDAAAWLSAVLGTPCSLVRIGPAFNRPVAGGSDHPGHAVGFADGYPFLAVSEASLLDVNRRIKDAGGSAVPMNRFRPNLVLAGCEPFAEDTWKRIRIGKVVFRNAAPCSRCIITTTDQLTGARGGFEPLKTLARLRRNPLAPASVTFGQYLIHEAKSGAVRVGDSVEVLEM